MTNLPPLPSLYMWSDDDEREESFRIYLEKAEEYETEVTEHTEDVFGGLWKMPPRQRLAFYLANEPVIEWVSRKVIDGPQTAQARQMVAQEILASMGIADPATVLPEVMQQIAGMVEQDPRVVESKLSMLDLDPREVAKMLKDYADIQRRYGVPE